MRTVGAPRAWRQLAQTIGWRDVGTTCACSRPTLRRWKANHAAHFAVTPVYAGCALMDAKRMNSFSSSKDFFRCARAKARACVDQCILRSRSTLADRSAVKELDQ